MKLPRFRLRTLFGLIALIGVLMGAVVLLNYFVFSSRAVFQRLTGLKLPPTASIVKDSFVETGPFGTDTSHCIRVKTDSTTINNWSQMAQFKAGPVVEPILRDDRGIPDNVVDSDRIFYSLDTRQDGRRGQLTVLDPTSNEAWLLMW
jgi:hypothetical protein